MDTIALKPDGFNVCVALEILDFLETLVMEIERIVEGWSPILTVQLAQLLEVTLCDDVVTILIFLHFDDVCSSLVLTGSYQWFK